MNIEDIYDVVLYNRSVMYWVIYITIASCIMFIVQAAIQLFESRRVGRILERVEKLLDMIEIHGSVTTSQKDRVIDSVDALKSRVELLTAKCEQGAFLKGNAG